MRLVLSEACLYKRNGLTTHSPIYPSAKPQLLAPVLVSFTKPILIWIHSTYYTGVSVDHVVNRRLAQKLLAKFLHMTLVNSGLATENTAEILRQLKKGL